MTGKPPREKKPSIKQLEYFVTIAKSSNFRRAAQKLGISQPTLTSQIAAMETILGTQLFERSRAGTLLSPTGREMLPVAREILEQYQQLGQVAGGSTRALSGLFRIGVSSTIGPYLLPRVIPALHKRYPDLKLHVREAVPKQLEQGLDEGAYDLILTVLPMSRMEYKVRPLFIEPIKIVMSQQHPLATKEVVTGKDLLLQNVLSIDEHHHLHRQIVALCEHFGANLQRQYEGNSLAALRLMVMMGMGIAFLPALYIQAEMNQSADVRVLELDTEAITRTHVAVWRKNSSSRHLFQKLSYEIKAIAMDTFHDTLEELKSEDNVPDSWI